MPCWASSHRDVVRSIRWRRDYESEHHPDRAEQPEFEVKTNREKMKYRPLGKSGIEASVVGFGAWAIGGWMWGGTKKNDPAAGRSGLRLIVWDQP